MEKIERKPLDKYFLELAFKVAERSTCRRRHIGAILVKDKHILSTGYNGACSGIKDCLIKYTISTRSGHMQGSSCRAKCCNTSWFTWFFNRRCYNVLYSFALCHMCQNYG